TRIDPRGADRKAGAALAVSEISRRTGLPAATASRLVAELVSYEFLARDADRRIRIGMRM
ncbi:helix-turn-helix domain-containing protein, partial [Streptomyces sp. 2MCAF27]